MSSGGCLCGEVRYEYRGELFDVMYCHCSICRKLHGSAFGAYGGVSKEHFNWIGETPALKSYASSDRVTRLFCPNCSSLLLSETLTDPGIYYISLGSIDGDSGVRPEYHQFVGSKASWYEITDDLPRYQEWPDQESDS